MAVLRYNNDEHPAGFSGYRVARTIGHNSDYRQRYFSFKIYGKTEAKKLALALDEEWKKAAEKVTRGKLLKRVREPPEKQRPNIITKGFRAVIRTEKKWRSGERRTYFVPGFIVERPGRNSGQRLFRIAKLGYGAAYAEAVKYYIKIHKLPKKQTKTLLGKLPPQTVFTRYLLNRLRRNGHKLKRVGLEKLIRGTKHGIN